MALVATSATAPPGNKKKGGSGQFCLHARLFTRAQIKLTGRVKDNEPQESALVLVRQPLEQLGGVLERERVLLSKPKAFGVEMGGRVGQVQRLVLGRRGQGAQPVGDGHGAVLREALQDARRIELILGAVKGARDDGPAEPQDQLGAETAVQARVKDQVLPRQVESGELVGVGAKGEVEGELDDVARGRVRPHDELGDDAKAGTSASEALRIKSVNSRWGRRETFFWWTHKEQVSVLIFARSDDAPVCRHDFDLDDMVECSPPHSRHRAKATL